jgi:hypothetical protein
MSAERLARRADAATRVRGLHPPLTALFAALRAELGEAAPPPPDPLGETLAAVVRDEPGDDADDLALRLAIAAEDVLVASGDDVDGSAIDAVVGVLQPYARAVVAGGAADPPPDLLARLRGVVRSAGVVAASRAGGGVAVQRFGEPWCPRDGCYGRDGAPLDDAWVAAEGLPPYGDGCNCSAQLAPATPPG